MEDQVDRSRRKGLRTIAIFEAFKGTLVLAAGFGLLSLIHHQVQHVAEHIIRHFHLNPARHYPRIFIQLAGKMSDHRLWMLALAAFAYSGIRLAEAYGLWKEKAWAEWFAVLSSGFYVPFEIYGLFVKVTWVRILALTLNLVIVVYIGRVLLQARRSKRA